MFRVDGISGVEFCREEDLVDNAMMEQLGFECIEVEGRKCGYNPNVTAYFYNDDCDYVYVECYIAKLDAFTKLIMQKKVFDKLGMKDKSIILNTGKGDGTRAVPSVRYNNTVYAIHKCNYEGKEVDHVQMSLNIITDEALRECNSLMNNKNKRDLHTWGMTYDGKFSIRIEERPDFLSENEIQSLRCAGYSVNVNKTRATIRKEFDNEKQAIKELRAYELSYYKDYAYNPLNDMRGHFEAKFDQLILGTKSEEDVIKEILADYANDAVAIARYNLEDEYISRGLQYNEGVTLKNGQFVS